MTCCRRLVVASLTLLLAAGCSDDRRTSGSSSTLPHSPKATVPISNPRAEYLQMGAESRCFAVRVADSASGIAGDDSQSVTDWVYLQRHLQPAVIDYLESLEDLSADLKNVAWPTRLKGMAAATAEEIDAELPHWRRIASADSPKALMDEWNTQVPPATAAAILSEELGIGPVGADSSPDFCGKSG